MHVAGGHADDAQLPAGLQGCQVIEPRQIGGNSTQDEVESVGSLLHLLWITGVDKFVSPKMACLCFLIGRSGKGSHLIAQRPRKLQREVSQAANSDYTDAHTGTDIEDIKRGVNSNAAAHHRSCSVRG